MRRSCLQRLCLDGDGMFFGNSGAKSTTTKVNQSHFIGSIFRGRIMEHTKGILIVALAEVLHILYNFLGKMRYV
jgi:hypothetical protein